MTSLREQGSPSLSKEIKAYVLVPPISLAALYSSTQESSATIWGHVVFDAVIYRSVEVDSSKAVIGSVRYEMRKTDEMLTAGIYLNDMQVVAYERGTHQQSPVREDQDFSFMGDLLEIRPDVFATGRVIRIEHDIDTFIVTVWQVVTGSSPLAHFTRGVSFTGDIMTMEDGVVVVALDGISYLPRPPHVHVRAAPSSSNGDVPKKFDEFD
ncbi:hypothetical protein EDB87DRAFT_1680419 [Lactarius vividus]|nr:hypothetical protein EDB87DRAFT_1680419 [Lactarius vividus]